MVKIARKNEGVILLVTQPPHTHLTRRESGLTHAHDHTPHRRRAEVLLHLLRRQVDDLHIVLVVRLRLPTPHSARLRTPVRVHHHARVLERHRQVQVVHQLERRRRGARGVRPHQRGLEGGGRVGLSDRRKRARICSGRRGFPRQRRWESSHRSAGTDRSPSSRKSEALCSSSPPTTLTCSTGFCRGPARGWARR